MKKYLLSILLAGSMVFSSCDMDLAPVGTLVDTSIENPADILGFRNGAYANLRALTRGAYLSYTEIQMDYFQALAPIYGNRIGEVFKGNIYSNNGDVESIFAGIYGAIANCNFAIPRAQDIIDNPDISAEDQIATIRYQAELYFIRAYYYYYLMDHYCATPSPENLSKYGMPLVTEYNPTADRDKYPGRSTLGETCNLILSDLDKAYEGLSAYEAYAANSAAAPMAYYVNTQVVNAFRARLYLLMGNNDKALEYAQGVIDSGVYTLASGARAVMQLWTADTSNEIIFMPFLDANEAGSVGSMGGAYINVNGTSADYIPSAATLDLYDAGDYRFNIYFEQWPLNISGNSYSTYVFKKFPGNPELNVANTWINKSKPFRLSEMYLIAAEAAANKGDVTVGNKYLNDFRKTRINRYEAVDYPASQLVTEVRLERRRELIGEGFRMSDLRRWGEGFTRDGSAPADWFAAGFDANEFFVRGAADLHYPDGDHRFIWPIPSAEMEVNPQLKGQQNPGY